MRKKVTCGYFSVSATRSCVRPLDATQAPSVLTRSRLGKAVAYQASWVAEYGDPDDPDDWAFISKYSPYQNISADRKYPALLMTTSTRDDRVHPGHARKFAARLQAMGYPALYFENTQGGHSNDSDPVMNAERWARHYVYLARALSLGVSDDRVTP